MKVLEAREKLGDQLDEILYELAENSFVYESQFSGLYSMFCKKYTQELVEIFSEELGEDIYYGYCIGPMLFYYFNRRNYTSDEVEEKVKVLVSYFHDGRL